MATLRHNCRWILLFAVAGLLMTPFSAEAEEKVFKLGVIYDYTGPNAASGGLAAAIGTQLAIDMINERGGVEGYKIVPVFADAESKTDVAVREAERLFDLEKVHMIMGVYSSRHCVPLAVMADTRKKLLWITVGISSSVFKDRNLRYVFRPGVSSDQVGEASCNFLADHVEAALGFPADKLRVAIIHEDGPYGTDVAESNMRACKALGIQVIRDEGFPTDVKDLSYLVNELKSLQPHVVLHTGYIQDVTLFLRQSADLGLELDALIGHGAGYAQAEKLIKTFGDDFNYVYNVDPVAAQLIDPKDLAPGMGELTRRLVDHYRKVTGAKVVPPHASKGFNGAWIFFTDVLPRAIKDHGGVGPEALRLAALETDIPEGGTIQGYGVKFYGPGDPMAGQNMRSRPVVMQYVDGETKIVWPPDLRTAGPVLPSPKNRPQTK